jgi:hypothetical protein
MQFSELYFFPGGKKEYQIPPIHLHQIKYPKSFAG